MANKLGIPTQSEHLPRTHHAAKLLALKNMGNLDTIHPIQAAQDERLAALKRCESIQHRSP